ncbi:MAG: hypothetical protein KF704_02455 [Crocinitomicaceae bacterium]|nr:hypothetical protein [Crocinitomicaceae bacterium]
MSNELHILEAKRKDIENDIEILECCTDDVSYEIGTIDLSTYSESPIIDLVNEFEYSDKDIYTAILEDTLFQPYKKRKLSFFGRLLFAIIKYIVILFASNFPSKRMRLEMGIYRRKIGLRVAQIKYYLLKNQTKLLNFLRGELKYICRLINHLICKIRNIDIRKVMRAYVFNLRISANNEENSIMII